MNIGVMGTHGVGKSTTIEELIKLPSISLLESSGDDHGNPIDKSIFLRQLWRLGKYISDYTEAKYTDIDKLSIRLIDRTPYDWEAYTFTFSEQHMLHRRESGKLINIYDSMETLGILPEYVIFIHPPYEWTMDRIKNRWNEEKKKWNEDDFTYLLRLRKQYERIAYTTSPNITKFLMVEETSLKDRVDKIISWIRDINPPWKYNEEIYNLEH